MWKYILTGSKQFCYPRNGDRIFDDVIDWRDFSIDYEIC